MTLTLLHLLHLITGVVWAGGSIFLALILYPALARLPAAQAQAILAKAALFAGPAMGLSGGGVMLTGPLRAWFGGGVQSFGDLASGYGLLVVLSLALTIAIAGFEGVFRKNQDRLMERPEDYTREAPARARRNAVLTTGGFSVLLAMMAMLGTGYY